jgi:hypothetical protein
MPEGGEAAETWFIADCSSQCSGQESRQAGGPAGLSVASRKPAQWVLLGARGRLLDDNSFALQSY